MAKSETDYIVCDHREVKRFSDTCEKKTIFASPKDLDFYMRGVLSSTLLY